MSVYFFFCRGSKAGIVGAAYLAKLAAQDKGLLA